MKQEELAVVIQKFASGLPKPIGVMLEDVDVLVCESPEAACVELREILEDWDEPLVADCKGVFVGEPLVREESDETEEMVTETMPEGAIALCASNISTAEEGVLVFLHEVGHALAMDEEEVKQLGLGSEDASNVPEPVQSS